MLKRIYEVQKNRPYLFYRELIKVERECNLIILDEQRCRRVLVYVKGFTKQHQFGEVFCQYLTPSRPLLTLKVYNVPILFPLFINVKRNYYLKLTAFQVSNKLEQMERTNHFQLAEYSLRHTHISLVCWLLNR